MEESESDQIEISELLQSLPLKIEEKLFDIRKIKFQLKCIYNLSQEPKQFKGQHSEFIIKEINQLSITNDSIIVFDMKNLQDSKIFILCTDSIIIIISKHNIHLLNEFLTKIKQKTKEKNNQTKLVFLTEKIAKELQISENEHNFSNLFLFDDIDIFESKLHFHSKDEKNEIFVQLIQSAVAHFILLKSYHQTQIFRHNNDHTNDIKNNYDYNDFIFVRNEGISSNLYFNVNDHLLYILKSFNSTDYESKRRYEREITCYRTIENKHPYISKYFGEFEYQQNKYIVIEYIEGQTLSMLKSRNKNKLNLNFQEKIKIIIEIMLSVEYFHSKGIILRDLKWDNIIIDSNHDSFLIDFDFSKKVSHNTDEMTNDIGSNLFSAPEQLNDNDYSYKTDLFSIGMLINFIINEKVIERNDFFDDLKNEIPQFPGLFLVYTSLYSDLLDNLPDKRPNITKILSSFLWNNLDFIRLNLINDYDGSIALTIKSFVYIRLKFLLDFINNVELIDSIYFVDLSEIYVFIGKIYYNGEYATKDIEKALYYFNLSSNLNNSIAQCNLGIYYTYEKDFNKALYYLNLSAKQNNPKAFANLGSIYFDNILCAKDISKANYYFKLIEKTKDIMMLDYAANHFLKDIPRDINKAIYFFSLASKYYDHFSLFQLGFIYFSNEYITRDIDKAIHYFILAANQNNLSAKMLLGRLSPNEIELYYKINKNNIVSDCKNFIGQVNSQNMQSLAMLYYLGDKRTRNIYKAIYFFEIAAQKNLPMAQYYLGEIYTKNDKLRDLNKAHYYLNLAVKNNYLPAYCFLGINYYNGKYFTRDITKGINYLTYAANSDTDAQFHLGFIYAFDINIKYNIDKALYYLNLAASKNDQSAQLSIGMIYFCHDYVPKDISKAIHYFTLSANQNNYYAQFYLGIIYLYEKNYIDINKSIHYFKLSSEQNYSMAYFYLAGIYYFGIHIEKDFNKAFNYLLIASKLDNSNANFLLGQIHIEGIYIVQNIKKAIYYFSLASINNDADAQYSLGKIYLQKKYNNYNINKALHFLNLSAKQNNNRANFILGVIYQKGKHVQQDINRAIKYYKEASNANNFMAKNNLGCIYLDGIGVKKNISYAIEYFNENIHKDNDILSAYNLARIYYFGIGCNKDVHKSIELLKRICNRMFFPAEFFLFLIYKYDEYYSNTEEANNCIDLIAKEYNLNIFKLFDESKLISDLFVFQNTTFDYGISEKHLLNLAGKLFDFPLYMKNYQEIVPVIDQRENITSDFYDGFGLLL